jgi:hypothetical protein
MEKSEFNKKVGQNRGFQIGQLQYPDKKDPTYGNFCQAIAAAESKSSDDSVWAVWTSQSEGSELMAIVYGGAAYTR